MAAKLPKQSSVKSTTLVLVPSTGKPLKLWEYPFPEIRGERFELFVNGTRAEAARTEGKGKSKPPAVRHYTYIKVGGRSMFIKAWLEFGSQVVVREA